MSTNNELIDRLQQAKGDTASGRAQREDATYAAILTEAQNFLNRELELCQQEFTLTLVADQATYNLDDDFVMFPSDRMKKEAGLVYYSAGDLKPTKAFELDLRSPGWRAAESGTPRNFYLERAEVSSGTNKYKIGLYQKASSTFIASYSTLTYYGVYRPAAIAANNNLAFDNNPLLADLGPLLLQYALWELDLEDGNKEKADQRWLALGQMLNRAREWVPAVQEEGGGFRFDPRWKRSS